MIQELIYNTLINYAGLTDIVGSRIFPVRLPREVLLPAVVYQIRSSEGINSITSGGKPLLNWLGKLAYGKNVINIDSEIVKATKASYA